MRLNRILNRSVVGGALFACACSASARDFCIRQKIASPPQWISNLEFDSISGKVVIVDGKAKNMVSYNPSSGTIDPIDLPSSITPTSFSKIQGGFLIKHNDDAAVLANPLGKDKRINAFKVRSDSGLGSLYSNWVTHGSDFVGFGSIADPTKTGRVNPQRGFILGFIAGKVSADSGQFSSLQLLEATEANDFYLFGFPYFASNDDGLFFLKMEAKGRASIVRVKDGKDGRSYEEEQAGFPEEFRAVPALDRDSLGDIDAATLFQKIENSKMAVGLFGQGKFLYLLTRQPDFQGGGTEWLMHKIDPSRPKDIESVRLPTAKDFLSVAIGPRYWYFFERGPVRAWGVQDIKSVLSLPSWWVTEPGRSPLSTSKETEVPCINH